MYLLELNLQYSVLIGVSAMVLLFASFLIAFVSSQRRKMQYHKELHALHEEQQRSLTLQNEQLEKKVLERTHELSIQKEELQKSLAELKSTQLQLVQREKMASLGELTAGIAHEIQNPLNFVNNFSEVSKELAEEMEKELEIGNLQEAAYLSKGLKENVAKIVQHGKRAEAIVKGMLQHATATSGAKEIVNLNDLAHEYLHLTYQSFRTRHKGFEVELHSNFDPSLEKIAVYPMDMVRVLVNLYNNAFYALYQKKKILKDAFTPQLSVSTKKEANSVLLCITDNGTGIPQKLLSKIYQPFFTTKPAGEGTGLGLSLSYDIVTKAHGGEIKVESTEGEGTTFLVQLPC